MDCIAYTKRNESRRIFADMILKWLLLNLHSENLNSAGKNDIANDVSRDSFFFLKSHVTSFLATLAGDYLYTINNNYNFITSKENQSVKLGLVFITNVRF